MKANPAFGVDSEAYKTDLAVQGNCDETADEKSNWNWNWSLKLLV